MKIMSEVSRVSRDAEFYKQQEIRRQRQRNELGCNPQKLCILKCNICIEENRNAEEKKTLMQAINQLAHKIVF
jgi:hypothetical protein